jgi:hypothetical protein
MPETSENRETKHLGTCPFCENKVSPFIVEENFIRRDVCECPECKKGILVCRMPGCQNYAKSGKYYDDELCPSCLKELPQDTRKVAKDALSIAGMALSLVVGVKSLKK